MDLPELIETFRDPLVGLIASWGPRGSDAAQLAQDSFAEAYLRRGSCRGDWTDASVFGPWLRGVARNVVRNWLRSERRRRTRIVASEDAVRSAEAANDAVPDRIVALREAIDRLGRKDREVVLMHYINQTPVADIAALLGVTARSVEGRLYRARQALRRRLETRAATKFRGVVLCL